MRFRPSLQSRFLVSVIFLLVLLVGSILFFIEKREVKTIFEESKNKGLLIAQNIANLNLQPLFLWDLEAIKKNIEDQVDSKLLYVIFYDRFRTPLVGSDFIRSHEDIFCCSRLPAEVGEDTYFAERINLLQGNEIFHILEIERPIFAQGSTALWGSVKVGLSLEDMRREVRKTRMMLLLIGSIGLLAGVFGAALLARQIATPIRRLADGTVRVSRGDFTHRIPASSKDEIGELARSFNTMTEQLLQTRSKMEEANRMLLQAEKLASIGRLAATIAHEIRNPLTSVKLNIQRLFQAEQLDETEREHLGLSQEGIQQIEKFIKELLNFTRVSRLNVEPFSLRQVLEESIKMIQVSFQNKNIRLEERYEPNLPDILADGDKLKQVFTNILRNSVEAVEDGGKVEVVLSGVQQNGREAQRVLISDNGPGIPEKDRESIFEPFITTKPSGFGLGLANARKILEQHNGSIQVVRKEGSGASFEILLPGKGEK